MARYFTKTQRAELAILLSVGYLIWRIGWTIPWRAPWPVLFFALALVFCEIISNLTAYILLFFRMQRHVGDQSAQPLPYPKDVPLPKIDLIIVTHNEPVALLKKTVNAATFIRYPAPEKVKIIISDDGCRQEVADLAKDYGVLYHAVPDNQQAKSGSLNSTLKLCDAPLFAVFDADMIPFSSFLEATVPLFLHNFQQQANSQDISTPLGFVQTAQSFYNADIFQFNTFSEKIIANEQDYFSRGVNTLNSANGKAIFTGSNTLFLRSAVDEVGGFPTDTITEDYELGAELNIAGYSSLSTASPQASGTTPTAIDAVMKQRTRWARGVIHSCHNLHIFTNPHLSLINRLILINTYFYWWSFMRRLIYIAAPLLYALLKVQVVKANFWILMIVWAPGYFLLQHVLNDDGTKIRSQRWGEVQETLFAPFLFLPVLLESLGIHATKFKVTKKSAGKDRRHWLYLLPYLVLWLLTAFAIIKFNYGKWGSEILVGSVITFWLLTHFINLSFCIFIVQGRPAFRKNERFLRQISGKILVDKAWQPIFTQDVSEGGIAFYFAEKEIQRLPEGAKTQLLLKRQDHEIHLTVTITRQLPDGYSGTVQVAKADANQYLELIYDGYNSYLPKKQDAWITPYDELAMNFLNRFNKIERRLSQWTRQ